MMKIPVLKVAAPVVGLCLAWAHVSVAQAQQPAGLPPADLPPAEEAPAVPVMEGTPATATPPPPPARRDE